MMTWTARVCRSNQVATPPTSPTAVSPRRGGRCNSATPHLTDQDVATPRAGRDWGSGSVHRDPAVRRARLRSPLASPTHLDPFEFLTRAGPSTLPKRTAPVPVSTARDARTTPAVPTRTLSALVLSWQSPRSPSCRAQMAQDALTAHACPYHRHRDQPDWRRGSRAASGSGLLEGSGHPVAGGVPAGLGGLPHRQHRRRRLCLAPRRNAGPCGSKSGNGHQRPGG